MDAEFWLERWHKGQIGFHQAQIHDRLQALWPSSAQSSPGRVFVPLCGKSLDMVWLRQQGWDVVGVELSSLAVSAFFAENDLPAQRQADQGPLQLWQAPGYRLYCGDFFQLPADALRDVNMVYDRAALVALPPPMRREYVATLQRLLPASAQVFLVTLEYDVSRMDGPPFSVDSAEVMALWGDGYQVESVERRDVIDDSPHLRERGINSLIEAIWRIEKKSGSDPF